MIEPASRRSQRSGSGTRNTDLKNAVITAALACWLVAGQDGLVEFDLVAQGLEPLDAALEGGLVAHGAGGRIDVDVFFHGAKYPIASRTRWARAVACAGVGPLARWGIGPRARSAAS